MINVAQKRLVKVSRSPVVQFFRGVFGRFLMLVAFLLAFAGLTGVAKADDISDAITAVSGYETAAVVVGVAVLLFVLGRRVVRRLIALAFIASFFGLAAGSAHAAGFGPLLAVDDITTLISTVSGYETAAVVVGVAVLLFVLGRRVAKRLI